MKRKLEKSGKLAIVFALLAFILWNCKEDPNSIGMELLPGSDLKTVDLAVDSTSIKAYTEKDLRLRTDEPNFNLFGTFNDPVFGKTTADLAFHVRLATYPNFDETFQMDSLVLYLLYKEMYGDTTTMQSLKVYELTEDIFIDTTNATGTGDYPYYQDVDLKALANNPAIGELDYYPVFRLDSTKKDTLIQELAIKLDNSLAERLIQADSLDMVDNEAFVKFFKGLYVESQDISNDGALMSLYTLATGSNLTIHYTKVTDTLVTDSLRFVYRINANSARITSFRHDYSTTEFADQLVEHPESPDSLIYLQTMGGLRAKLDIPTLENWRDSVSGVNNIIINKAALVFQVDTVASDYHRYRIPADLILTGIDEEGKEYLPADFALSSSLYGGKYNSTNATYTFNITHHLQNIINNKVDNYGFYLAPSFRNEKVRRVVLKGASSHAGIRLQVTYTKLN